MKTTLFHSKCEIRFYLTQQVLNKVPTGVKSLPQEEQNIRIKSMAHFQQFEYRQVNFQKKSNLSVSSSKCSGHQHFYVALKENGDKVNTSVVNGNHMRNPFQHALVESQKALKTLNRTETAL